MKILFALLTLIVVRVNAGIIDIEKRPLRVLNIGSEVYVHTEGDLSAKTTYQDGRPVLIGWPPFDEKKPYCTVEEFSIIPDFENRKNPIKLSDIEGAVVDTNENDSWTKFITKLHFAGKKADINITCFSDSKGAYKEITLGEFEKTFGTHLRYGNLSLGDPGVEIRSPLYGEYDVLTAELLRKSIKLSVLQPIKLIKNQESTALEVQIVEGKIVETNEYTKQYCSLLYVAENGNQLPNEIMLPQGLELKFTGSVQGSYQKSQLTNDGFILMADLVGYEKTLQLYCSSNDPNKPLRYLETRYITKPILDWSYYY